MTSKEKNSKEKNPKKRKLEDDASDSEPPKKKQKISKSDESNKNKKSKKKDETMTKNEFLKYAKNETVICGDIKLKMKKKKNKTGSVGFGVSEHDIIKLDENKKVAVMIVLNATVIGSKEWEDGDEQSNDENKENEDEDEDEDEDDDIDDKNKNKKEKGDTMTKSEFLSIAKELPLKLFDQEFVLKPKKAKSGSVGWQFIKKIQKEINDIPLRLQTSVNITVKKSKVWEEGENKKNEDKDKDKDKDEQDEDKNK